MKLFFSILMTVVCCAPFAHSKGKESVRLYRSEFQDKSFITISYTSSPQSNQCSGDLKEFWKQSLFHSLLQQRLQQNLAQEGIQCTLHQSMDQPSSVCSISVSCHPSQVIEALSSLCHHIEQIKKSGFSERELKIAKEKAHLGLSKWEGQHFKEMACLISNQISNEPAASNLNNLIEASKDLIEMASLNEVTEFSRTQIIDDNREIDLVVPSGESFISEQELCQILEEQKWVAEQQMSAVGTQALAKALLENPQQLLLEEEKNDEARPQFEEVAVRLISNQPQEMAQQPVEMAAPIVENSPVAVEEKINYYAHLQVNPEEKRMISKIIVTLAENNVLKLLFEKKKLEKLGKRINHIHPMKFLGTILSDQRLYHCLREIRKSSFKWEGFMDGFVRRMNEELSQDNVKKYVPGFSASLQTSADQLTAYIERRDFEGLVVSLL